MGRPLGSTNGISPPGGYPSPPDTDSDFLAGFLDAEGSFNIRKQHSGAFGCYCSVSLRRDDRELLAQLQEGFRLGTLTEVPARRTSKPQVCWTIARKADCTRLVELLREHPLRGRKSLDFDIWASAVDEWVGPSPSSRPWKRDWSPMALFKNDLEATRRYAPRIGFSVSQDKGWKAHLAGYLTGEVHLGIHPRPGGGHSARIRVNARGDDLPLLQEYRALTEAGTLHHYRPAGRNPIATWSIQSDRDRSRLVDLLDATPLRGKKAREYQAWRRAARQRSPHPSELQALAYEIERVRSYEPPVQT